jgi:hypothetical protein
LSTEEHGVPQPPSIEKRWVFHTVQKIGVPLIVLIPLLALFGLFGESSNTVSDSGGSLAMEISYPTRFRYKMTDPVVVSVENLSSQPVPTLTVSFDYDYISGFSTVTFSPSVSEITEEAYLVHLNEVQAGEVRQIVVDIQAEQYWNHSGTVAASTAPDQAPDVELELSTFVFP